MSITLYDIFYQHTEWWNDPSLGHDTQGKYGKVLAEMEYCALEYAKDIKDIGDKWKRVIENETRELCRQNHYSFFLTGEKRESHDIAVKDFLIKIRKAMEHYGFNFKELSEIIQKQYGIEYFHLSAHKPQPEAPQNKKRRGRPKESFKDKMIDDPNGEKLQKIHKVMKGKRGKDAALIILACIEKGWLHKPTFKQVEEEFGDIGVQQGFTRYLNNENSFSVEEKEGAIKSLD